MRGQPYCAVTQHPGMSEFPPLCIGLLTWMFPAIPRGPAVSGAKSGAKERDAGLSLNQRVVGSSPTAPTNTINRLSPKTTAGFTQ